MSSQSTSISSTKSTLKLNASKSRSTCPLYVRSPGLHIYEQIRDRVNKKGLLRKLSEYLLVHRTFLNESMQHNFRLMRQRKSFLGRVTSLVVIDHLIENLERFV